MQKIRRSSQFTQEELESKSRQEMIEKMSDREVAFCEYYVRDNNSFLAAMKAGFKTTTNKNIGNAIRNRPLCIDYIAWLKLHLYNEACINATDLLNSYAKLALFDINDYVKVEGNKLKLQDLNKIDGQIIQEISQNSNGTFTVKFPDRLKALDKLNDFMMENPYDWKRKLEERKAEMMEEKLKIEKMKVGLDDEIVDDNFLEALKESASAIYNNMELIDDNDEGEE